MPRNKDLKRLVRARMTQTGEAYTAALAKISKKPRKRITRDITDYAALAGMTDEAIKAKTGWTWKRWVGALDALGADRMAHRDIASLVSETYKIDGWWSQSVTVGYERIKGLRARGQRRDGTYEASKSRTFGVPVTTLFDAWADAKVRGQWLKESGVKVRTATAPKSMRLGWPDGTIVAVGFTPKGTARSAVALAHTKLPDDETAKRLRERWSESLDELGELLAKR